MGEMLSRYRQSLKELFIVSEVEILGADAAAKLREMAQGRNDFAFDGTFARVSRICRWRCPAAASSGRKCPRCWIYWDAGDGERRGTRPSMPRRRARDEPAAMNDARPATARVATPDEQQ